MNRDNPAGAQLPCAACRHQRRRCDATCEFVQYLPGSKYDEFFQAQKIFSVSNIQKMIISAPPQHRQAVVDSILAEASMRQRDPVLGAYGVVRDLKNQVESYQQEIAKVKDQIAVLKIKEQEQKQKEQGQSTAGAGSPVAPLPVQPGETDLKAQDVNFADHEMMDLDHVVRAPPSGPGEPSAGRKAPAEEKENPTPPLPPSSKGKESIDG